MLVPGGVFSGTLSCTGLLGNIGAVFCAWTKLSDGNTPPETTARASAPRKARVMTGMYCLIDSPIGLLNEKVPALPPTRDTPLPPEMPYSIRLQLYHYYVSIEIRVSYLDKYKLCSILGLGHGIRFRPFGSWRSPSRGSDMSAFDFREHAY